ncbi:MAG: transketolase C-terminal domain-containing protein [Bacteroidota bacterium]|nr:thiamine pyrophosphate-dependent enzyme [Chlorobiota bacterium]MDW8074195.1 transketolase C-terminal domain-containing protein [Bacteroidota bacterium]MDW8271329.1 transketolase C-terminal domain-containing protein [Bacteroidota bacterium]
MANTTAHTTTHIDGIVTIATGNGAPLRLAVEQYLPSREEILRDYALCVTSRKASLLGRREVLTGKAKFGIFGDGKEVPQVAMARAFEPGDVRSGYYRDQTFMFATGMTTVEQFFAQLYAIADVELEPSSAGRSMNGHFATRMLNPDGSWKAIADAMQSSADVSPTGSQMPRLVGLAYASCLYRELPELQKFTQFSHNGREIAWGTIGNASCAEGMFWEAINAIGVLRAPAIISIWDDEYGISVPNQYQITKGNLSEVLRGFQRKPGDSQGFDIYTVPGWDYPRLVALYAYAAQRVRQEGFPAIIHVVELTQPQGHSTSGSHERYKSKERLQWEAEHDCNYRMRQWILASRLATEEELAELERRAEQEAVEAKERAWNAYITPIRSELAEVIGKIEEMQRQSRNPEKLQQVLDSLRSLREPYRADYFAAIHKALVLTHDEQLPAAAELIEWRDRMQALQQERYSSHLYSQSAERAELVPEVKPVYSENSPLVNGFEVLNANFRYWLERDPRVIAFGEDVGRLGDVNQGFAGLQQVFGPLRVSDTGIRECTIVGQAIGMAMRGLRPIAEVQYLDYLLYALQIMSDDLATVQWRTKGGQKAPVIIRTRGHRLEGIWHSGSPMAGIINLVRGMHVCVPRDMTRAAGFYNTILRSDEPALIVEVLNGYRLKERLPDNIGEFTVPLGVPEILRSGNDVTIVTYGALCRIALQAAEQLALCGIEAEVIDVQTLLPFDRYGIIVNSLKKTGRILFVDEDVPGGTTAYMLQQVIERDGGYRYLDSPPRTLSAAEHRPAYGTDGNYWSKPEAEHIFRAAYELLHEADPRRYPLFYDASYHKSR